MSFTVTDRPSTGKGARGAKLTGDELAAAIKALKGGRAIVETIAKPRKSVQTYVHQVRSDLRAALGLESSDITSTTKPTPGSDPKADKSWDVTVFLTDAGLQKVKQAKPQAPKNSGEQN